jgi:two-component system, OmpR family, osmolarity sensor histidine kinase EnvZ
VFALTLGVVPVFAFRPIGVMRVLMNLMQNAVVYAGEGLSVRTWADASAGAVFVEVADRGAGVCVDDLEALKAPFKRGRSEGGMHPGGTGLGLAIVERIAKLHGGGLGLARREGGGVVALVWFGVD